MKVIEEGLFEKRKGISVRGTRKDDGVNMIKIH